MFSTESGIYPEKVVVEKFNDTTDRIILSDLSSVVEEIRDVENDSDSVKFYKYNYYVIFKRHRNNFKEYILQNFDSWLNLAKSEDYNSTAKQVREKRNKLLEESDKYVLPDRISAMEISGSSIAEYRQKLRDLTKHENFPYLKEEDYPKM